MQVEPVKQLKRNRGDEDDEHQRVRSETGAPEVDRKPKHQYRRQLDAAQLRDQLEYRVKRRLPGIVHGLRDLKVEVFEGAGGDRDRQRDKRHAQHTDRDESRG